MTWLIALGVTLAFDQDDKDIKSALGSAERGNFDQAEHALNGALNDPSRKPAAERALVRIRILRADASPPSQNRIELIEGAIAYLEQGLRAGPDRSLRMDLAHALEIGARTHKLLGNTSEARRMAGRTRETWSALFKDASQDADKLSTGLGLAFATWLAVSICDARDPFSEWLAETQRVLEELQWTEDLDSHNAGLWLARAYIAAWERGDANAWKMAAYWFKWARALPEKLFASSPALSELYAKVVYYEMSALRLRSDTLRRADQPWKEALSPVSTLARDFRARCPNLGVATIGGWIFLEEARVRVALGERTGGVKILRGIVEGSRDADLVYAVRIVLADEQSATRDDLYALGDSAYRTGDVPNAIRFLKAAIETSGTIDPAACWNLMGKCYFSTGRTSEALVAFDQAASTRDPGQAREAARLKYRCLIAVAEATEDPTDKANVEAQRKVLDRNGWLDDLELRNEAIHLMQSGSWIEAEAKWSKLYQHATPQRRMEALAQGAMCFVKVNRAQDARALAEKALAVADAPHATDPSLMAHITTATFCVAATFLESDPGRIGPIVNGFAEKYAEAAPEDHMRLLLLGLRAQLRLGLPSEAQKFADRIEERFLKTQTGQKVYVEAIKDIGKAYDQQAAKVRLSDPQAYASLLEKATQYLYRVVQLEGGSYAETRLLATQCFEMAKTTQQPVWYEKARAFFEAILSKYGREAAQEELTAKVQWHIAVCRLRLGNFDAAQERLEKLRPDYEGDLEWEETLGDAYFGKAGLLQGKDKLEMFKAAERQFVRVTNMTKETEERHFRALYKWFETLSLYAPDDLAQHMKVYAIRGLDAYDNDQWGYRSKIKDLRRSVESSNPKR